MRRQESQQIANFAALHSQFDNISSKFTALHDSTNQLAVTVAYLQPISSVPIVRESSEYILSSISPTTTPGELSPRFQAGGNTVTDPTPGSLLSWICDYESADLDYDLDTDLSNVSNIGPKNDTRSALPLRTGIGVLSTTTSRAGAVLQPRTGIGVTSTFAHTHRFQRGHAIAHKLLAYHRRRWARVTPILWRAQPPPASTRPLLRSATAISRQTHRTTPSVHSPLRRQRPAAPLASTPSFARMLLSASTRTTSTVTSIHRTSIVSLPSAHPPCGFLELAGKDLRASTELYLSPDQSSQAGGTT